MRIVHGICALMQVLDDSTDRTTRNLVDDKVLEWLERGVAIECLRRTNRAGYKAGALKEVQRLHSQRVSGCAILQIDVYCNGDEPACMCRHGGWVDDKLGSSTYRWRPCCASTGMPCVTKSSLGTFGQ